MGLLVCDTFNYCALRKVKTHPLTNAVQYSIHSSDALFIPIQDWCELTQIATKVQFAPYMHLNDLVTHETKTCWVLDVFLVDQQVTLFEQQWLPHLHVPHSA